MNEIWFGLQRDSILAIAMMAIVTYSFRGGGYWLMGRITLSPRLEAGLAYLPGAVITALVVPAMLEAGVPGVFGVAAVALCMRIRPNLLLAMSAGILAVWLLRQIL
jgi:uncharacterized membrane protein